MSRRLLAVAVLAVVAGCGPPDDGGVAMTGASPVRPAVEVTVTATGSGAATVSTLDADAVDAWVTSLAEAEWYEAAALHAEQERRQRALEAAEAPSTPPPAPSAPAPAPTQPAATRAPVGACGGWQPLVAAHFGAETGRACRVLMCESQGNPNAHNPTSSASGLFQFLDSTWRRVTGLPGEARAYSPSRQVAAAKALRDRAGWGQWVCR